MVQGYRLRCQGNQMGKPAGAIVTKLCVDPASGTVYAGTYGRGAFALNLAPIIP